MGFDDSHVNSNNFSWHRDTIGLCTGEAECVPWGRNRF